MPRHLKTRIYHSLECIIGQKIPASDISALHTRGVRYMTFVEGIDGYCGMMNERKEGLKYRKHIIVRRYARHRKVYQLYTYHFPKTWSAACVANRELIKEAQRQAHALEHDTSRTGLEWRLRFLNHYFKVFKGHAKPEPGMKPYSRFYQYTYVAIYRELQAARKAAQQEPAVLSLCAVQQESVAYPSSARRSPAEFTDSAISNPATFEPVTFDPIELNPLEVYRQHRAALRKPKFYLREYAAPNSLFSEHMYSIGTVSSGLGTQESLSRGRIVPMSSICEQNRL